MAQIPHAEPGKVCPLHKQDMSTVCHKCPLWVHLRGTNPNTGGEIDEYNCSLAWLPVLMIEGAQQTRQAGAAIESFRNEMVKLNEQPIAIETHTLRTEQLPYQPPWK